MKWQGLDMAKLLAGAETLGMDIAQEVASRPLDFSFEGRDIPVWTNIMSGEFTLKLQSPKISVLMWLEHSIT